MTFFLNFIMQLQLKFNIILCKFQVYSIELRQLYILQRSPLPFSVLIGHHIYLFFHFFYCCSSRVVSILLPPLPHPSHPHLSSLISPPLVFSMCPLYTFLKTLHLFPYIISSHLPSGYCPFVLNFNISTYILLACFVLLIKFHL